MDLDSVIVLPNSPAIGKSIPELKLRTATGATVVSIERGTDILLNPDITLPLQEGDRVLLLGDPAQIDAVRQLFRACLR